MQSTEIMMYGTFLSSLCHSIRITEEVFHLRAYPLQSLNLSFIWAEDRQQLMRCRLTRVWQLGIHGCMQNLNY